MSRAFKVIDMPQRSPEWFAARAGRLTASNAKHITSFLKSGEESAARRDYKMQLVTERLTGQPQDDVFVNDDMRRGIELEPDALAAYESQEGVLVTRVGFLSHTELMAGGSPDGVVGDFEGLVEIKCPRAANHVRYLRAGGIPAEHKAQLTHLLWLTDAPWIEFVSYCPQLPQRMRLYVCRMANNYTENPTYDASVRRFLNEVEMEEAALRGWGVLQGAVT